MFAGYYILGDRVPLRVWSRDNSGTPTLPDDNPLARIYDSSGTLVASRNLPIDDPAIEGTFFFYDQNLDSRFSTGRHTIHYTWQISSTNYSSVEEFVVEASGSSQGKGISTHFFQQPNADYVLIQTDTGYLSRYRNPRVER